MALQALEAVTDSPCEPAQWAGANKCVSDAEPTCLSAAGPAEAAESHPIAAVGQSPLGDLEKPPSPLGQEGCGVREEAASRADWRWR